MTLPANSSARSRPRSEGELGIEGLGQHWSLGDDDRELVLRAKGDLHRLRAAIDLCSLRATGAFVSDWSAVPPAIVNHLARQLALPAQSGIPEPTRRGTTASQRERLRAHLGYGTLDHQSRTELRAWLTERAASGSSVEILVTLACTWLRERRLVRPGEARLVRLVAGIRAQVEENLHEAIHRQLSAETRAAIDDLLLVADGESSSGLARLRGVAKGGTAEFIVEHLGRLDDIDAIPLGELNLPPEAEGRVTELAAQMKGYDAWELRRMAETNPARSYALVACFLHESRARLLDQAVRLHDSYVTQMTRRAGHRYRKKLAKQDREAQEAIATVFSSARASLESEAMGATWEAAVEAYGKEDFLELVEVGETLGKRGRTGFRDEVLAGYPNLRRFMPRLLRLPLRAERGAEALLRAVKIIQRLDSGELKRIPRNAPYEFVKRRWREGLFDAEGRIVNRRLWEVSLSIALRDAMRSGDVYLAGSQEHASFSELTYSEEQWAGFRLEAYDKLALPIDPDIALKQLGKALADAARHLARGLDDNPFASIKNGKLKTKKEGARPVPEAADQLRAVLLSALPFVRLERVLMDVDGWCGFTAPLREAAGPRRKPSSRTAILAALVAHGTNLGVGVMAKSTVGFEPGEIERAGRQCLRAETLREANRILVDYHSSLPIAQAWGSGRRSGSDGQRFAITADSMLATYYTRYFGYYDKALSVVSHMSDQYSVFATQVISCAESEALYVLDGLLQNDTILEPTEHTVDSHGATIALYGLCHLLGFQLQMRPKNLKIIPLFKDREGRKVGKKLEPIFAGAVDLDLVRSQWDELVRIAASLRWQTAPARVIVQRLTRDKRSKRARALVALGRLVRTIYLLRYLGEPELRAAVSLHLSRIEGRNGLAAHLFHAQRGAFTTGEIDQLAAKATALSVMSNVALCWTSVHFARYATEFAPDEPLPLELLAHISPLAHRHFLVNGTYRFDET